MKAADKINRLASQKVVVVDSDRDASPNVPCKKKDRNGVFPYLNQNNISRTPNQGVIQSHCIICKNYEISEHNYMSHSSETWF